MHENLQQILFMQQPRIGSQKSICFFGESHCKSSGQLTLAHLPEIHSLVKKQVYACTVSIHITHIFNRTSISFVI